MSRVVISGGAGFLPSHLCDRFLEEGHEVVALDNFITGRRKNVSHLSQNTSFSLIEHDIIETFQLDGPVDYVMHMASPASPPDFKTIPFETMKANSFGAHNMLEFARDKGARFFVASTSEVYGDPPAEHHPQNEEYWGNVNPNGARSVYDESKRYAEAVTMAYHREYGLETRIIRIFNTYGPRMRNDDGRVITNFVTQALKGEPITLYGDGSQTRSFSYVSDTVDGIYKLLLSDETNPVNIGNPKEFTMIELAELVLKHTQSGSEIICVPQPFADDPKQRKPDITKAKNVLGWEPVVPLEEGLQRTIEYVRSEIG